MVLQPDMVQRKGNSVQRLLPLRGLQFALPYRDAVPPHLRQPSLLLSVPLLVSSYLRHPELPVRLRNLTARGIGKYVFTPLSLWRGVGGEAPMTMPEAPVHKDARPVLSQHQVGMSRQPLMVQPIPESPLPQPTPHNHLRLRVLRLDSRHVIIPLLRAKMVHDIYTELN